MTVVIMEPARGPYTSVGIAPSYFTNEIYQAVSFFTVSDCICACVLVRATCPTHLIVLDLIALMLFDEDYTSRSSSLCNFLQSPVYSSLLGPTTYSRSHQMHYCSSLATCWQFRSRHGPTAVERKHCHTAGIEQRWVSSSCTRETGMLQRATWNRQRKYRRQLTA
jgi:hypothetical protein